MCKCPKCGKYMEYKVENWFNTITTYYVCSDCHYDTRFDSKTTNEIIYASKDGLKIISSNTTR